MKCDQVLGTVVVGPCGVGKNKFDFKARVLDLSSHVLVRGFHCALYVGQAHAPDASLIPKNELLGNSVVLLSASFHKRVFACAGFYVNTTTEIDDVRISFLIV